MLRGRVIPTLIVVGTGVARRCFTTTTGGIASRPLNPSNDDSPHPSGASSDVRVTDDAQHPLDVADGGGVPRPKAPPTSDSITNTALGEAVRQDSSGFTVGYNLGMLSIQLETMRTKLDDNRELLKSQLSGLRETTRAHHDSLRRLNLETTKQTTSDFHDGVEKLSNRFDTINSRLTTGEEAMKELSRQQFSALQKHIDDRLENIKDLVKLTSLVLLAILVWILLTVANIYNHVHHHSQQATWLQVQSNSALLSKLNAENAAAAAASGGAHSKHTYDGGKKPDDAPKKGWLW